MRRGEKLPVSRGGGLTAKGRLKYNRATGSHLKPPPHTPALEKTRCDEKVSVLEVVRGKVQGEQQRENGGIASRPNSVNMIAVIFFYFYFE